MCLLSVQHHICKYILTIQSDWINTVTRIDIENSMFSVYTKEKVVFDDVSTVIEK